MTSIALKVEEIKVSDAEQVLSKKQLTTTPEAQQAVYKSQQRARAQLRVIKHVKAANA